MNFEFKNKKNLIFIIIFILLLLIGGFFWWWEKEKLFEEWGSKYSPREDYVIKETPEGEIIENKKMGFKTVIPEGWKLEENWKFGVEGNIVLTSSDFQWQPGNNPSEKGCLIEIGIKDYGKYETPEIKTIKDFIEMCKLAPDQLKKDGYEYLKIDGYEALRTTTTPETKRLVSVKVLIDKKVYGFGTPLYYSEDKEKCFKEFNKFLETISIK